MLVKKYSLKRWCALEHLSAELTFSCFILAAFWHFVQCSPPGHGTTSQAALTPLQLSSSLQYEGLQQSYHGAKSVFDFLFLSDTFPPFFFLGNRSLFSLSFLCVFACLSCSVPGQLFYSLPFCPTLPHSPLPQFEASEISAKQVSHLLRQLK